MDSPSHFFLDKTPISQLDINNLVNIPFCAIDISDKGQKNPDYELSVEDIINFEAKHGVQIPQGSLVVCRTGWDRFWDDKEKYRAVSEKDGKMHYPVFSLEAVRFLDEKRNVNGIGIDTLSPETNLEFPIHCHILGKGKYIVENLRDVEKMPEMGGVVSALPLKAEGITEGPVRVVGLYL